MKISDNTASQVTGFTYGNSVSASFGYSADRLQMTSLSYTKSGTSHLSLSYSYSQSGNNNGQIAGITDSVQSGRTVAYTYDSLNRLKTAVTNGSTPYPKWGLQWTYDRYGNRSAQTKTYGTPPENSVSLNSSNQITAMSGFNFSHDANGSLTQDDLYKYKYDAENRLVEIRLVNNTLVSTYAYDGHSLRVIKVVGADRTWYLYAGGQVVSEFEDAASNTYSSGTTPGSAPSDSVSTLVYQHGDHLTSRITTDQQGNVANQQAHYPYGENWYASGTADPSVLRKFTSYEKDAEVASGQLHYAIFRTHGARIGRFLRPDPKRGRIRNPQRLNRYAYVTGNPINFTDRRGLDLEDVNPEYGGGQWDRAYGGGKGPLIEGSLGGSGSGGSGPDFFATAFASHPNTTSPEVAITNQFVDSVANIPVGQGSSGGAAFQEQDDEDYGCELALERCVGEAQGEKNLCVENVSLAQSGCEDLCIVGCLLTGPGPQFLSCVRGCRSICSITFGVLKGRCYARYNLKVFGCNATYRACTLVRSLFPPGWRP